MRMWLSNSPMGFGGILGYTFLAGFFTEFAVGVSATRARADEPKPSEVHITTSTLLARINIAPYLAMCQSTPNIPQQNLTAHFEEPAKVDYNFSWKCMNGTLLMTDGHFGGEYVCDNDYSGPPVVNNQTVGCIPGVNAPRALWHPIRPSGQFLPNLMR